MADNKVPSLSRSSSNQHHYREYMQRLVPKKDDMKSHFKDASMQKKCFAELVGTFTLVFTVGLIKTSAATNSGVEAFGPTAIACILTVMMYSLGPISGGHFNPAITFACTLHKKIDGKAVAQALLYWIFQCGAGVLAGLFAGFLSNFGDAKVAPTQIQFAIGAPIVEFVYTFMLCFVALNVYVAGNNIKNNFYGIAIGFVVIAGGYGGRDVSGAAFNPAITLGITFMGANPLESLLWLPIYIVVQLCGGMVAVVFFQICRKEVRDREDGCFAAVVDKILSKFDPDDTTELIGTFLLTYTVGLNALSRQKLGNKNPGGAWSNGACLMCLVYSLNDISGSLFNPALTLACCLRWLNTGGGFGEEKLCDPKKSRKEGLKYLAMQFIGGGLGAFCAWGTYFAYAAFKHSWPPASEVPPPRCDAEGKNCHPLAQAFCTEIVGTMLFSYVVLCVATVRKPLEEYKALAIGGCLMSLGYAVGPISGAFVNPAIAVANSAFHDLDFFYKFGPIAIVVAEFIGAALAAVLFKWVTHKDEYVNLPFQGTTAT